MQHPRFAGGKEPRVELSRELRRCARERRIKGFDRLFEHPAEVLAQPHETFALLVGPQEGGGVTRAEFCKVGGWVGRWAGCLVFRGDC